MKYMPWLLLLFCLNTTAQTLPDFVAPKAYQKVLQARGDLDRDGLDEVVLVYNSNKETERIGFKRILYICKEVNGVLKLWKQNLSVLWNSRDCGFCLDAGINLSVKIKNYTIIIEQTFQHNSRHYSTYRNVFRYQNNDWYLIGSKYNDYDTCHFDFQYDINFSTRQVVVDYTHGDCDDGVEVPKDRHVNFRYAFKSIPKMDGFTAGKTALKIPNSDQFFYY